MEGLAFEAASLEHTPLDELLNSDDPTFDDLLNELGDGLGGWDQAAVSGVDTYSPREGPLEESQEAAESLKRPASEAGGSDSCDDGSAEAKRRKKLEKNRAAAALSRSRKKDLVSSLQQRVSILEQANVSMSHALAMLQAENQHLRGLVKGADDQTGTAVSLAAPRLTAYRHAAPRGMLARSSLLPLLWCFLRFACLSQGSDIPPPSAALDLAQLLRSRSRRPLGSAAPKAAHRAARRRLSHRTASRRCTAAARGLSSFFSGSRAEQQAASLSCRPAHSQQKRDLWL